ncbi:signal peptidase I [Lentilitoribacter sp. EG35]|uniref:signal peptidase I n=1 Tax=Lentilitoribacter sp. Alg239-R112 TaxID=2305987 RepID=UPI0013A6CEB4|nr:signal peptidase I [Lentilitoribacter sp. Alg239-R112]
MADKAEDKGSSLSENIKVLFQAVLLAVFIRTILFQPFSIPSSSMENTLLVGDYLFVSKFSYGYSKYSLPFSPDLFDGRILGSEPERGDIIVFRPNHDLGTDYIKRLVGLPGDKVQVKEGVLHINGTPVKRELSGTYNPSESDGDGVPIYTETLPNGVTYKTLDLSPISPGDDTREFLVPQGHYFLMGDNRDNSSDSRFAVGFVPFENLVGKAQVIFFSMKGGASPLEFWKWPTSVRLERIFTSLAP